MDAITDREEMIQQLVRAYFNRRSVEELNESLSEDEVVKELATLNQRWKAPGDMDITAGMVREARKRALEEREGKGNS